MARAPVSKTGGWGFETLHPCQPARRARAAFQRGIHTVATSPAKFVREVRAEVAKVTWPSRKETGVTTGLVLAMAGLAAAFFFIIDQVIGLGVRQLFHGGF